jgi:transposase
VSERRAPKIEIITGCELGLRYCAERKQQLVEKTIQPGMTVSTVARPHGVSQACFSSRGN